MKERRIAITIGADGALSAEADGFEGDACLDALDALLQDLASGPATIERKPDAGRVARRKAVHRKVGRET